MALTNDTIIDTLMSSAARSTLPFQEAETADHYGTAFWYNHLLEGERYTQYLVTAAALTGFEMGHWTLRPELGGEQGPTAENLLMPGFAGRWTTLPRLGIAVLPAAELHAYAERKGWQWTTDEITDGLAATTRDLAYVGVKPVPAYLLAHDVTATGRPQGVFVGDVALDPHGRLRWATVLPPGCAGAPVFIGVPLGGGQFKLACVGVILPGEGYNEIAPFDQVRREIAALTAPVKRRWWKR